MSAEPITITPLITGGPTYTLADQGFVAKLVEFEAKVAALTATPLTLEDSQNEITKAGKDLEAQREVLTRPALDWQRLINNTAKPVAARLDAAKRKLGESLTAFALRQQEIAAEAQRKRLAELYELEEKARKEREARADEERIAAEKEAARQATLTAAQKASEPEELDWDVPAAPPPQTATERQIEKVMLAPVVVPQRPSGVRLIKKLVIVSTDIAKLPEMFVLRSVKEEAIRKTYCVGWKEGDAMPEVAGVVFRVEAQTASTGRI